MTTHTFPVSAGLIEHKQRMGAAIWEFLWLVDSVTSDEPDGRGEFLGIVKYGSPVSADTVARDLNESIDTAKVNLRRLSTEGYVIRKRMVGAGYSYHVVNSKKWSWKRSNGHRVENPSMEKAADDRVENPPQIKNPSMGNLPNLGKKPADDRRETYSNNKEDKTLLRQRKRTSSPDGAADHHNENIDPRHVAVRTVILDLHLKKFRVTCEWNGREGKALNELLAENPTWTEAQISVMVQNRFASDGVTSSRPGKWISALGDYAAGPLDKFNKVKGGRADGKLSASQIYERERGYLRAGA